MNPWTTLVRREFWENRALWIAPLVTAGFLIVGSTYAALNADHFAHGPQGFGGFGEGVREGGALQVSVYVFASMVLGIGALAVTLYALDCLYAERKDRSILFWKSLPLSDAQTVLSKVAVACLVMPVALFFLAVATHLIAGAILSMGPGTGPGARLMWTGELPLAYGRLAGSIVLNVLWYLPLIAYAMLASVLAPRTPILVALLPPILLVTMERIFTESNHVARFVLGRLTGARGQEFWLQPSLWLGVLAGAAILLLVIRLRRWRDDT